jgi:hypothetical protein
LQNRSAAKVAEPILEEAPSAEPSGLGLPEALVALVPEVEEPDARLPVTVRRCASTALDRVGVSRPPSIRRAQIES